MVQLETMQPNLVRILTGKEVLYFSYDTIIARYVLSTKVLFVTTKKFSKTTSKHMNIIKDRHNDISINIREVDQSFLEEIA